MADGVSITNGVFGVGQWTYLLPDQRPPKLPPNKDEIVFHQHEFPQVLCCPCVPEWCTRLYLEG